MDRVFEQILRTVLELSDDFTINPECDIRDDLGADSLQLMMIIIQTESRYGIELTPDVLTEARSVAQMTAAIRTAANSPAVRLE